ncbi:MAG: aspartate 1-decarboxylase [Oceanicoccus sp.]|uniref:aspartate 1-decarboxylase n=1 Tax=Oceanicoccus sp. TaxID=2691044 RepID=UPI002608C883|nr:aspartate 1-decarboxylase [Oceanicoccus sp.]MCP3907565.1 aspartate 1-decarboxylase [Oceanicoccus sp.]MDG1772377.1 aspartate 1-decarboxylase [Oceanicoccus sp.]
MQLRSFMSSKIHKATVTEANLDYVGSITIDADLLDLAGLLPNEKVLVVSNTSGARLETYIIEGKRGTGYIGINGAASHLIEAGEEIIIIAFTLATEPVEPKAILVDKNNRFVCNLPEEQAAFAPETA